MVFVKHVVEWELDLSVGLFPPVFAFSNPFQIFSFFPTVFLFPTWFLIPPAHSVSHCSQILARSYWQSCKFHHTVSICVVAMFRTCAKFSKWGIVWHNVTNAIFLHFYVMNMILFFLSFSVALIFSVPFDRMCNSVLFMKTDTNKKKQKKMIVSVNMSSPLSMCGAIKSDYARQCV